MALGTVVAGPWEVRGCSVCWPCSTCSEPGGHRTVQAPPAARGHTLWSGGQLIIVGPGTALGRGSENGVSCHCLTPRLCSQVSCEVVSLQDLWVSVTTGTERAGCLFCLRLPVLPPSSQNWHGHQSGVQSQAG